MKKQTWLLGMCALVAYGACGGGARVVKHRAAAGDLAIVGATVVPMDREGTLAGQTVLVRGDRIVAVAPSAEIDTAGATIIDGRGKWLVPGLADMHVHVQSEDDLALFLLNGVTIVRDLFGFPDHLRWRDAIAKGTLDGPVLVAAGPIIDGDPPTWPGSDIVTTPEEARAVVQAQKAAGYDWLKVYNSLPADAYEALLVEAKAQGMPVAGHVPRAVGIDRAIVSGQRTIEHLDGYVPFFGDPHVDAAIIAATVAAGVWNCPTLVVTDRFGHLDDPASLATTRGLDLVSPFVLAGWDPKDDFRLQRWTAEMYASLREKNLLRAKLVGDLARAGANLVLGTDTGNPYVIPGFAVHDELALLVGAGLTPWQALRTATVAPAELLGTPGAFGVVAEGARADLLLVDRDPLADIGGLADPAIVIVRGKVHRHDDMRKAIHTALEKPTGDRWAAMPALEAEGTALATGHYDVVFRDQTIGGERAVLSRAADGTHVVRGQAVYDSPKMSFDYRATPSSVDMTSDTLPGGLKVSRQGAKVVAVLGKETPLDLAAGADAVVAPQVIAEFFWYAELLADLKLGAARTLTAVEVRTERGVQLEAATFTFTRRDDADGRRVYDIVGKMGALDLTGTFTVDPDGAPHEVTLVVKFGTFTTRRTE